jgi:hypothetical protein
MTWLTRHRARQEAEYLRWFAATEARGICGNCNGRKYFDESLPADHWSGWAESWPCGRCNGTGKAPPMIPTNAAHQSEERGPR